MAKARAIVKRRKAIQNIRKITRTMELIATARYRKAQDRAVQAEAFTRKIAELAEDLARQSDAATNHPLLERRDTTRKGLILVITSNRGLAGGYNSNVFRAGYRAYHELLSGGAATHLEVVGKRGINFLRFRGIQPDQAYTEFTDRPEYAQVEPLANRYIEWFVSGQIDRLEVAYTRFISMSQQTAVVETLLPMTSAVAAETSAVRRRPADKPGVTPERRFAPVPYEYEPDPRSILDEVVPVSFKVRLFKCFLDAAVSEQIARMIAMRGATENADDMITSLTRLYNRARQSQITRELSEIIGGAAALE